MNIKSIRLRGVRCFEDTGLVSLSPGCNLFVGQNNAGKSTLLRGVLAWQNFPFTHSADARPDSPIVANELVLSDVTQHDFVRVRPGSGSTLRYTRVFGGGALAENGVPTYNLEDDRSLFKLDWPNNYIVPFVAKRKAQNYHQSVNSSSSASIDGTFSNLYARIDRVVSPGLSAHEFYRKAVEDILGVFITTKSSSEGKEAGYYFGDDNFVPLDRMGDGVSEMVALIVELSLARGKVFVLEEPETNLHPKGLKALLELIRESASRNQFIIATHSNVVVRELASHDATKLFRVYRDGESSSSPSRVAEVERTPMAHMELLRELGYEFGDFNLHEGWLFLEEASAETVIRDILIPWFSPELKGRLRTFSAGGVSNLEPTVAEFQRLITFVHLDPVYRDRIWVRGDGDDPGRTIIAMIQAKFPYLASPRAEVFSQSQFELFYPSKFSEQVSEVLAIHGKHERRAAKAALLVEVLEWTANHEAEARLAWEISAAEQIELLKEIVRELRANRRSGRAAQN